MAMAIPFRNESTTTSHTVIAFNQVSTASVNASNIMADCVTSSSFRLFTRSAITPPKSVNKRNGIEPANPTTPSQNAELVSVSTSQPWAIFCIHVPMLERKFPLQNRRKFAWRSARTTLGHCSSSSAAKACVDAAASSTARLGGS